jgi:hypothetical protein
MAQPANVRSVWLERSVRLPADETQLCVRALILDQRPALLCMAQTGAQMVDHIIPPSRAGAPVGAVAADPPALAAGLALVAFTAPRYTALRIVSVAMLPLSWLVATRLETIGGAHTWAPAAAGRVSGLYLSDELISLSREAVCSTLAGPRQSTSSRIATAQYLEGCIVWKRG